MNARVKPIYSPLVLVIQHMTLTFVLGFGKLSAKIVLIAEGLSPFSKAIYAHTVFLFLYIFEYVPPSHVLYQVI